MQGNVRGFTLIELMIVVSIIGILAAVAIPSFNTMKMRSQRVELPTVVEGIRRSEKAYFASWDAYLSLAANPGVPQVQPQDWNTADPDWVKLGYRPDGKVRGNYQVVVAAQTFTASGESDLDRDGVLARVEATDVLPTTMVTHKGVY